MSRDDSGSFLPGYAELEIVKKNPFATIDQTGVGALMKIAIEKGRVTRPDIKLGICGEHGGEPDSVKFCHKLGLTYVSCSPYRVPVARLAAARRPSKRLAKPPRARGEAGEGCREACQGCEAREEEVISSRDRCREPAFGLRHAARHIAGRLSVVLGGATREPAGGDGIVVMNSKGKSCRGLDDSPLIFLLMVPSRIWYPATGSNPLIGLQPSSGDQSIHEFILKRGNLFELELRCVRMNRGKSTKTGLIHYEHA